ncbi:TetR/AcrR family transcriptional regulator [Streptococcus oricebi]|uniref:TetR family transcriptional regulator n=1 Tax=Streptococcus oricebi TaxID=1547447 RepID=A0ABS5B5P1_9STRE|nr:TetR/AcrR family transcriptional regulator [Streptococcus oricebi]MBP2624157.1 TetR family transcriptional regulator [Streptococcus oricebi]
MSESNKRRKTKKLIEQAMVNLLMQESFDHITTVKLAETANISRSSFYTHYKDKYDMIERYQQSLFNQLEFVFEKHSEDKRQAILEVFDFLEQEPLLSALLSDNGTREIRMFLRHKFQNMLGEDLQERFGNRAYTSGEFNITEREYSTVYLTNAFFGVFQMWISRGKKESPEQMTDFLLKMLD